MCVGQDVGLLVNKQVWQSGQGVPVSKHAWRAGLATVVYCNLIQNKIFRTLYASHVSSVSVQGVF